MFTKLLTYCICKQGPLCFGESCGIDFLLRDGNGLAIINTLFCRDGSKALPLKKKKSYCKLPETAWLHECEESVPCLSSEELQGAWRKNTPKDEKLPPPHTHKDSLKSEGHDADSQAFLHRFCSFLGKLDFV